MEINKPTIVIVDCDAGFDDAWAILLLISAKKKLNFEIAGITCVSGNTTVDNVCINVLRLLDAAKCSNIPIYKGASTPLILSNEYASQHTYYHGMDGFGDISLEQKLDLSLIKEENAVVALNKIAVEHKGKVSLLCLGPLTNIALAIRTFATFQHDVKDIYFMGGNYKGVGNVTDASEFNFWADPEAAQIVLQSEIKAKFMLPWETCSAVEYPLDWRFNVLGRSDNEAIQLLNKAEQILSKYSRFWRPADEMIAAFFVNKNVAIQVIPLHVNVELHGMFTRGQAVVGHISKKEPNVFLIAGINKPEFEKLLMNIHSLS